MDSFKYTTGNEVRPNDKVRIGHRLAQVEQVIEKGSSQATHFSCQETGGILLNFDDGDLQLWPWIDEDLVFLERG